MKMVATSKYVNTLLVVSNKYSAAMLPGLSRSCGSARGGGSGYVGKEAGDLLRDPLRPFQGQQVAGVRYGNPGRSRDRRSDPRPVGQRRPAVVLAPEDEGGWRRGGDDVQRR